MTQKEVIECLERGLGEGFIENSYYNNIFIHISDIITNTLQINKDMNDVHQYLHDNTQMYLRLL